MCGEERFELGCEALDLFGQITASVGEVACESGYQGLVRGEPFGDGMEVLGPPEATGGRLPRRGRVRAGANAAC